MSQREKGEGGWASRLAEILGLRPSQANLVKYLAIAIAIGILFLNAGQLFGITDSNQKSDRATEVTASPSADSQLSHLERQMESNLAEILSLVDGAGSVKVHVNLLSGPTAIPVPNTREEKTTTEEKAGDNSTRQTTTTHVDKTNVVTKEGGRDLLAVLKQTRAEVAGVLVVAPGAGNPAVRARLYEAASTALGISAHRITIVPSGGR